jgi:asparagine synthase (glutamine-hydrolysing)
MCGICGIYNAHSEEPVSANLIEQMMKLLEHRGPDDQGLYLEKEIGLGFRRLSIIDLTGGNQPISNETDDIWVVFNGEIWNYRSLREELRAQGHIFRTQGDAEVIVHAYEEYGTDCLTHLHGMFGLAIWDSRQKRLLLARDRAGKKPLYYSNLDGNLVFASEIKSLFSDPRLIRQADLQSLADFLSVRYVPGPATMFKNVYKVQPGHWLLFQGGTMHEECYWDFSFEPLKPQEPYPVEHYMQEVRKHIFRAVEERMVSDVPVGALLSGGVDSSIIAGIMSKMSKQPVKTFAVGFNVEGFSELPYARQVSEHFGTENHELMLGSNDLIKYWPLLTWHRDEPVSEDPDVAVYLLSRLASSHVKVILSGEGGDELFAGYPKYVFDSMARYYHLLPVAIRHKVVTPFLEHLPYNLRKATFAGRSLADPAPQRWVNWFGIFNGSWKTQLLASSVQAQVDMDASRIFQRWLDLHPQRDNLSRMLYLDTKTWLPDNLLIRNDKMTMAASIEGRMPFLDEHLITYAASIPSELKVRGLRTKYLLKQAFADFLPEPILTRKKMGFNMPLGEWFQKDQRTFISNLLLSERMRSRGLFNHTFIEYLLREHLEGHTNYQAQLFHLASLEIWFRVFIDPQTLSFPDRLFDEAGQEHLMPI